MTLLLPLGRVEPSDWRHVEKYPLMAATPQKVERRLRYIRSWKNRYDQGTEGACVGFASSQMMSILNRMYYDAFWLYREAQKVDEWPGEDYDGTSVRAAMDILREVGHRRVHNNRVGLPNLKHGISANRWARNIDEIRDAIRRGIPVTMGTNWYSNFDRPIAERSWTGHQEHWIGKGDLGRIRGGHAWCIIAASDKRQAFQTPNSWGQRYPRRLDSVLDRRAPDARER